MDALFTAFDISNLSSNIASILLGGVSLLLLFTAYRLLKNSVGDLSSADFEQLHGNTSFWVAEDPAVQKSIERHRRKRVRYFPNRFLKKGRTDAYFSRHQL